MEDSYVSFLLAAQANFNFMFILATPSCEFLFDYWWAIGSHYDFGHQRLLDNSTASGWFLL